MANTNFVRAVRKAKGLYKSGRYKRFSDAVAAAHRQIKRGSSKKGKKIFGGRGIDSSSGAGHTSTSTKAHTSGNKTSTKTVTAHVKIGRAKRKAKQPSKRQQLEKSLGSSYVRFFNARTISATNKERKTMATIKSRLKKL